MSGPRFIILVCVSIAAAACAFVTHLALRFQNIAIGYNIQHERDVAAHLREHINQLQILRSGRYAPATIETMARTQLGMVEPDRVTTYVAGGPVRPGRLSGRPQ